MPQAIAVTLTRWVIKRDAEYMSANRRGDARWGPLDTAILYPFQTAAAAETISPSERVIRVTVTVEET